MKLNNYQVYWMYLTESGIKSISSKMNRKTRCVIKQNDEILTVGETLCSQSDMFSKETGRKISLSRALKELYPSGNNYTLDAINKNMRTEFWNKYRDLGKYPKWKLNSKKIAKEIQDIMSNLK